ncbi:ParB/Sulfiredoxin domain-containing protein (plasmid) [Cupriavidus sp. H19C3]|uniref:ParB/RepB/Spo0J family partition protein n=1 Tax=Cupriavidus sp. H19C3 TaxID=3241603 RepID=UPI003BF86785
MAKSRLEIMREQATKALAVAPPADRFARAQALVERQPNGFAAKAPLEEVEQRPTDIHSEVADKTSKQEVVPANDASDTEPYYEETDIALVDENPFNARRLYHPERVHELAASIRADGQLVPGIATIRNGRRILAGGHYRLRALKVAGKSKIRLLIHPGLSDQQLYQLSYKENAEREQQTPLDNAIAWEALIKDGVYGSESAIAEVTGMSLPNVNKTLSILKLSQPILEIVKERPESFALTTLYQLRLLEGAAGSTVATDMALKVRDEAAVAKDVEIVRTRYETRPARKTKETSRQHKLVGPDGTNVGVLKDWDSGKVTFEITLKDAAKRQELIEELKAKFSAPTE